MGKHEGRSHASKKPVENIPHRPAGEAKNKRQDAYHADAKCSDAMVCKVCGVTSHAGKWSWNGPPLTDVHEGICPACQRIRDDYPAGIIELRGLNPKEREEIRNLIRNVEATEKAKHPLERLMAMREEGDSIHVTTTGLHLGRAIAGALGRRFHDRVVVEYPGDARIRVTLDR